MIKIVFLYRRKTKQHTIRIERDSKLRHEYVNVSNATLGRLGNFCMGVDPAVFYTLAYNVYTYNLAEYSDTLKD